MPLPPHTRARTIRVPQTTRHQEGGRSNNRNSSSSSSSTQDQQGEGEEEEGFQQQPLGRLPLRHRSSCSKQQPSFRRPQQQRQRRQ